MPFYKSLNGILTTTHHTDIGILYLAAAFVFFFLGGIAAMLMRFQLSEPNNSVLTPANYAQLFTVHGSTMVFLWIMPAFAGFGNILVPKLVGAADMYWPKLNSLAFWMVPAAGALIWLGSPGIGWSGYAPLSVITPGPGVDLWILGLMILGVSSTIGSINFIATIFKLRAPSVTFRNMSLFVWTILVTSFLIIGANPVLAVALAFLIFDRNFGTAFFIANKGGDPILWQHLFWFFAHPEVYILILPGMGLISEILPRMAHKRIFGYGAIAGSSMLIGIFGFGVWVHHMFTSGLSITARVPFAFMTLAVGVPSGVKVFNWIATLIGGRIKLATPMLFALSFVATFFVGGATGVFQASIPVDYLLHESYWVVGHFHFIVFGASTQAIFSAIYFYFPMIAGKRLNERLGKIHFVLTNVGLYALFGSMMILGLQGMPRRVFSYPAELTGYNVLATVGAVLIGLGVILFVFNILNTWKNGERLQNDPWE